MNKWIQKWGGKVKGPQIEIEIYKKPNEDEEIYKWLYSNLDNIESAYMAILEQEADKEIVNRKLKRFKILSSVRWI